MSEPTSPAAPASQEPAAPVRAQRPLIALLAGLTLVVLAVDQGTKIWAESALRIGEPVPVLGDLLRLTLVYNSGAAFSLGSGMTWLLALIATVVVAVIIHTSRRLRSRGWAIALGLLLGGALGNLGDRFFREPGFPQGHVVDFIDYGGLFVGNVADIAIVVAAGVIVLLGARGIGVDGSRAGARATDAAEDGAAAHDAGSASADDAGRSDV